MHKYNALIYNNVTHKGTYIYILIRLCFTLFRVQPISMLKTEFLVQVILPRVEYYAMRVVLIHQMRCRSSHPSSFHAETKRNKNTTLPLYWRDQRDIFNIIGIHVFKITWQIIILTSTAVQSEICNSGCDVITNLTYFSKVDKILEIFNTLFVKKYTMIIPKSSTCVAIELQKLNPLKFSRNSEVTTKQTIFSVCT